MLSEFSEFSEFQEEKSLFLEQKRFSSDLAYTAQGFPSRWRETPPDIVVLAHSEQLRDHFPRLTRYSSLTLAACLFRFDPLAQGGGSHCVPMLPGVLARATQRSKNTLRAHYRLFADWGILANPEQRRILVNTDIAQRELNATVFCYGKEFVDVLEQLRASELFMQPEPALHVEMTESSEGSDTASSTGSNRGSNRGSSLKIGHSLYIKEFNKLNVKEPNVFFTKKDTEQSPQPTALVGTTDARFVQGGKQQVYRRTVSADLHAPVLFEPLDATDELSAAIRLPRDLLALTTDYKLSPMQVVALMRLIKTNGQQFTLQQVFALFLDTKAAQDPQTQSGNAAAYLATMIKRDLAESSIAKRCSAASVAQQSRGEAERLQQRIDAYAPGQMFQHIAANIKFVVDRPGFLLNNRNNASSKIDTAFFDLMDEHSIVVCGFTTPGDPAFGRDKQHESNRAAHLERGATAQLFPLSDKADYATTAIAQVRAERGRSTVRTSADMASNAAKPVLAITPGDAALSSPQRASDAAMTAIAQVRAERTTRLNHKTLVAPLTTESPISEHSAESQQTPAPTISNDRLSSDIVDKFVALPNAENWFGIKPFIPKQRGEPHLEMCLLQTAHIHRRPIINASPSLDVHAPW